MKSLIIALLALSTLWMGGSAAASPPEPEEVLSAVGFTDKDTRRLLNGQILPYATTEPTDKTLSVGLSMYLKSAPNRLAGAIRRGALSAGDPEIIATGDIPPGAGVEAFRRFTFANGLSREAESLLHVEAGPEFNLSASEIGRFQALARTLGTKRGNGVAKAVVKVYREILLERVHGYQNGGFSGISPYDRGGGEVSDGGSELRVFTQQNRLLELFAPDLQEALLRFPAPLPPSTTDRFLWVNRMVQDRPTAILSQQLIHTFDDAAVIVQNEFYAGHSFNVGQLVIGAVPFHGGSLALYTHRSSSDQVAGFGQSLKHSIGREGLQKVMIKRLKRLKSSLY